MLRFRGGLSPMENKFRRLMELQRLSNIVSGWGVGRGVLPQDPRQQPSTHDALCMGNGRRLNFSSIDGTTSPVPVGRTSKMTYSHIARLPCESQLSLCAVRVLRPNARESVPLLAFVCVHARIHVPACVHVYVHVQLYQ